MAMNVIHQNGCKHVLSRIELENIVEAFPAKLSGFVDKVILHSAKGKESYVKYYSKSRMLGLFSGPEVEDKEIVIDELLVGVNLICSMGGLPKRITKNRKAQILKELEHLKLKCFGAIDSAT